MSYNYTVGLRLDVDNQSRSIIVAVHVYHVRERITLKLCLLVYKAMNGPAPPYMKELCVPVTTVATRSGLRSAARGDLLVPRTRRQLGNRAFSVAGPTAWNSLPLDIRTAPTPSTLIKKLLKTHLFSLSYNTCM